MKLPFIPKSKKVKIGSKYVGQNYPVFFIAEIGINHNGDLNLAKKLISEAKKSGATAVKFQKRDVGEIFTAEFLNREYKSPHAYGKTYGEHRDALEFHYSDYKELFDYAKKLEILLFASVWDLKSVDFMERFSVDAYKIASADMSYFELIERVSSTGKPVLISTGMATQEEIKQVIRFTRNLTGKFIFMHCTSAYPADDNEINLNFMKRIALWSKGNPVGYSGHEKDWLPSLLAVVQGASVIERHLTLDKNLKGSDHSASLTPDEFYALVDNVRRFDAIYGDGQKQYLNDKVIESKKKLGKSIYTNRKILKGDTLTEKDVIVRSPGGGLAPNLLYLVLNKKAKISLDSEHQISITDLD